MKNCKTRLLNLNLIDRDYITEKKYGIEDLKIFSYLVDNTSIFIIGEIMSNEINKGFSLFCKAYDNDGDLCETQDNEVTYSIKPKAFYNGFPFAFYLDVPNNTKISRIEISLEEDED